MNITINGKPEHLEEPTNVQTLVERLGLDLRKIAIERNLAIVPRSTYARTILQEGDAIEIVEFIGGG